MTSTTHADLAPPRSTMSPMSPGTSHVDMAKVEFCGLAGFAAFVLPSQARHPAMIIVAGAITLHHPPASVQALVQILGWDSTPGLIIEGVPRRPVTLMMLTALAEHRLNVSRPGSPDGGLGFEEAGTAVV